MEKKLLLTKLTNIDSFAYHRYTFPSESFAFTLNKKKTLVNSVFTYVAIRVICFPV